MMKIEDRCFLVTGAGSGLGEATARALVERGAAVVIADIDRANGARVGSHLGGRARFVETDVTEESSVRAAIGIAREAFGGLSGAVSCAGIGPSAGSSSTRRRSRPSRDRSARRRTPHRREASSA